ncbi:hypothetical protein Emag_002829 [Eimeria magna]
MRQELTRLGPSGMLDQSTSYRGRTTCSTGTVMSQALDGNIAASVADQAPSLRHPVRLILSDIDGTLTDDSGAFVVANAEGVALAHRLGVQVAFATGRGTSYVTSLIDEVLSQKMGYRGSPGIYMNGAYVLDAKGVPIVDAPLQPEVAERLLKAYKSAGFKTLVEGRESGFATGLLRGSKGSAELMPPLYTLYAIDDAEHIQQVRPQLEAEFAGAVEFSTCRPTSLGAHRAGFGKGAAVRSLAAALGVSLDEVLVLGDGENDLPMFREAGTAVAVGNAGPAVKAAADLVTVDSNQGALLAVVKKIEALGLYPQASSSPEPAEAP